MSAEPERQSADQRWYALVVRPRREKAAAASLRNKGIEHFLPLQRSRRMWSDRIQYVELPLFSGYVFCRFALRDKLAILRTAYVSSIIGFADGPVAVPEAEIRNIRSLVVSGLPLSPWPFLEVGQRVHVDHGPLRGVEGILIKVRDSIHVVVTIEILQRAVAVTLDPAMLSPIGNFRPQMAATPAQCQVVS